VVSLLRRIAVVEIRPVLARDITLEADAGAPGRMTKPIRCGMVIAPNSRVTAAAAQVTEDCLGATADAVAGAAPVIADHRVGQPEATPAVVVAVVVAD
jgi:hypothetical protein